MRNSISNRLLLLLFLVAGIQVSAQRSLSLEQCKQMALEHNQKLLAAKEATLAATDLRKAAFTQFFPDFGFTGSYVHGTKKLGLLSEDLFLPVVPYSAITPDGTLDPTKLGPTDIVINPVTQQPVLDKNGNPVFQKYAYMPKDGFTIDLRNFYSLNFGVTQPIFTGGKILNLYKSAKYLEQISRANQAMEAGELLYKVETSYWQVISLQEKVKLAASYRQLLKKLIYDLENFQKEGIIINNDLLKARVRENEAELAEMKAGNGLILSKMALCQVIGLPLESQFTLSDTALQEYNALFPADLTSRALANRQELNILRNNVNLSMAGVNLMKSRFMPDIGITAGYGWMNPSPYSGFEKEFEGDLTLAIGCKIPLWHWGERVHTLNAAKHQMRASELKVSETEELIALQARQAQFSHKESIKKAEVTRRSVEQATENLKVTLDKFSEGILKTTDVLEAETMWQKAFSENIDAWTDIRIQETNTKKVIGELQKENK